MQNLLSEFTLGKLVLSNRVVMAPLTRRRATEKHVPTALMREYYEQRASAGLIIAEATQISPDAVGYPSTPGIHNKKQILAWEKITEAVHDKGGKIFLQLWHVGRHSHPDLQPGNKLPVAPSAVEYNATIFTGKEKKIIPAPRVMTLDDIQRVVRDFGKAAKNAKTAGFDGIEIHGANGYLIDQFLQDSTNLRNDNYGGSIENRSRLLFDILEVTSGVFDDTRVGLRLSPSGTYHGMYDSCPIEHFSYIVGELGRFNLAYLHIVEPVFEPIDHLPNYLKNPGLHFRSKYQGTLISSGGYSPESAEETIKQNHADLIAFGKLYISNPDLVERIKSNIPLSEWDTETFYEGGAEGYTDYPKAKTQKNQHP